MNFQNIKIKPIYFANYVLTELSYTFDFYNRIGTTLLMIVSFELLIRQKQTNRVIGHSFNIICKVFHNHPIPHRFDRSDEFQAHIIW